jgi:hypothetical protein
MEDVKEDSNMYRHFWLSIILELLLEEEGRQENVATPLASGSHKEYLIITKLEKCK